MYCKKKWRNGEVAEIPQLKIKYKSVFAVFILYAGTNYGCIQ